MSVSEADLDRELGGTSRSAAAAAARERILAAARSQFREMGYERASLQQIGDEVGLTRGAVLYHFSSKAELLASLLQPFVDRIDADLARFESAARAPAPRTVLAALLAALLETRSAAELLARDVSGRHALDLDRWFTTTIGRLTRLLAPDSDQDPRARIRALAALGAIVRPLAFLPDELPPDQREAILAAAVNALRRPRRSRG